MVVALRGVSALRHVRLPRVVRFLGHWNLLAIDSDDVVVPVFFYKFSLFVGHGPTLLGVVGVVDRLRDAATVGNVDAVGLGPLANL